MVQKCNIEAYQASSSKPTSRNSTHSSGSELNATSRTTSFDLAPNGSKASCLSLEHFRFVRGLRLCVRSQVDRVLKRRTRGEQRAWTGTVRRSLAERLMQTRLACGFVARAEKWVNLDLAGDRIVWWLASLVVSERWAQGKLAPCHVA